MKTAESAAPGAQLCLFLQDEPRQRPLAATEDAFPPMVSGRRSASRQGSRSAARSGTGNPAAQVCRKRFPLCRIRTGSGGRARVEVAVYAHLRDQVRTGVEVATVLKGKAGSYKLFEVVGLQDPTTEGPG